MTAIGFIRALPTGALGDNRTGMTHSSTTFSAVIRSSNDRRVVLAESADWHTKHDAEVLGVAELARSGWTNLSVGVLCIEERA
jgi:hypothetical protein